MVRATDEARLKATLEALLIPANEVPLSALRDAAEHARLHRELVWSVLDQRENLLERLDDEQELAGLSRSLAHRFGEYVRGKNQFLTLASSDWPRLPAAFDLVLRQLRHALASSFTPAELGERLAAPLVEHILRLDAFVRECCPASEQADDLLGTEPTADQYSAGLQLSVLRLDLADLVEPVLDVGCGSEAGLVRHLRTCGVDAHGIDLAVAHDPPLVQADWMTYPFGLARWGTIVAHMSFTNHFVFQDLCSGEQAEKYALTYMRILRSLRPGGAFYYAPAVPFIEEHLPCLFSVTRHPVASLSGPETGAGAEETETYWHELVCAVRVHKRR